jgi:hypothetical protein
MNQIHRIENLIAKCVPEWLASLALRFGIAIPFWKSGLTKWDGFGVLSETPVILFENEFMLDLPRFDSASLMRNTSHQGERLWQRYTMKSLDVRRCGLH